MTKSWILKYHPQSLGEFVGNQDTITQLHEWFHAFQHQPPGSKDHPHPILFLYGNTGIGKTTLAYLMLQHYGYQLYEMNSGDVRSRKRMEDVADKILGHRSIDVSGTNSTFHHVALLMDEIDGMSCGDKGGLHYLFELAEQHHQAVSPILCISTKLNDKSSSSSSGHSKYTEVEMSPPSREELRAHCERIAHAEGMKIHPDVIDRLLTHCQFDIRKSIILLQQLYEFYPETLIVMSHLDTLCGTVFEEKEEDLDLFAVTERVLTEKMSPSRIQYYYQLEPNLMPLMVYENIPYQMEKKKLLQKQQHPLYHSMIYPFALMDVMEQTIATHVELHPLVCITKCESINFHFSNMTNKKSTSLSVPQEEKIRFTCSLSKSALISNNLIFMTSFSRQNHFSYEYFPHLLMVLLHLMKQKHIPLSVIQSEFPSMGQPEFDKMLQFYQKWCVVENPSLLTMKKKIKALGK